jgi:hypothetical protein
MKRLQPRTLTTSPTQVDKGIWSPFAGLYQLKAERIYKVDSL